MRSMLRRVMAAFILAALLLSLSGTALADPAVQVSTPDALKAALEDGAVTAIELQNNITSSAVAAQGTKTVYLNGYTWNIGGLDLTGVTADASAGGGYVLRTAAGSVAASPDTCVFVAQTLALNGAADGETVQTMTAGGAALHLYAQNAAVSGGSATVYVRADELSAMASLSEITTDAGRYVPGAGGGMTRVYAVAYSDIVDAAGIAPQMPSNVSAVNAQSFTADDTALTLTEPTLMGYTFVGWTWTGQTALVPATGGAQQVNLMGMTGLDVVAHWAVMQGGGGGRTGGGTAAAGSVAAADETPASEAALTEAETSAAQSVRLSRGSSSTRVSFSDGDAIDPMRTAAQAETKAFPWALAAGGAAVLAGLIGAAALTGRRKRRKRAEE